MTLDIGHEEDAPDERSGSVLSRVLRYWSERSLVERFSWTGGAVMVICVLLSGIIISSMVRSNVLYHRAVATALFVDSTIARHLYSLRTMGEVTDVAQANLDSLFDDPAFRSRIPYLDIWGPDGTVLYSNTDRLIGMKFELPEPATRAFEGDVVAAESDLTASEHTTRDWVRTYTEIYTPLRALDGSVVAVSEIHEASEDIGVTLHQATVRTGVAVALACATFWLALFSIVAGGSKRLKTQEEYLACQLKASRDLAERNDVLRAQALDASTSMTEHTDNMLRTIGSDLHDGPSQLISFGLLKVERVRRAKTSAQRATELHDLETNLARAMSDIRNIARGLALPAVEGIILSKVIEQAVSMHVERTGMDVETDIHLARVMTTSPVNVCTFRFVQEGLNNAFRHSRSNTAKVEAGVDADGMFRLVVTSAASKRSNVRGDGGMGLKGLKARVDTLGGDFGFTSIEGCTHMVMQLELKDHIVHG